MQSGVVACMLLEMVECMLLEVVEQMCLPENQFDVGLLSWQWH